MSNEDKDDVQTDARLGKDTGANKDDQAPVVVIKDDGGEASSGDGQSAGAGAAGADTEAKREARREERRLRKIRRREYQNRDQARLRVLESNMVQLQQENKELKAGQQTLQEQNTTITANNVKEKISEAQRVFNAAKALHQEAVTAGDGARATQAMDDMFEAKEALYVLNQYERQLSLKPDKPANGSANGHADQPAPGFRSDEVKRRFEDWHERNPWYDLRGAHSPDRDSRIAFAIDTMLTARGLDPSSDEYWDEMEDEVAKQLPHRLDENDNQSDPDDEGDDAPPPRRTTARDAGKNARARPATGGSGRGRAAAGREITISGARASAMREMGLQPGTKEWVNMAKKYESYDKQQGSA
jgi:hypothetical protein